MEDDRDADDAIRGLDRIEFGRKGRRLRVEWTKERGGRRPESSRKSSFNSRPSKTLFVINFDPYNTRTRDLEKHFDPYGKILNIRIRRNFAFVQYESQEDATRALDATNMSKLMDRVVSVEYAIKDDDDRRNGYSPHRTHDMSRSPIRSHDRRRSPSPYGRERASPDYGRGPTLSFNWREKPFEYDRGRSPSPPKERPSPLNGRVTSPKERDSPEYGQEASPSPQRERLGPDGYRHGASPNSKFEVRDSPRNGAESPMQERYSHSLPSREGSQCFDE